MEMYQIDEDAQEVIRKKIHEITGIYSPRVWQNAFLAHTIAALLELGISKGKFLEAMSQFFDYYKSQMEEQQ